MADTKTFYTPKRDRSLWRAAKRMADLHEISESQLIRDAVADYLPRLAEKPVPEDRWAQIAADQTAA